MKRLDDVLVERGLVDAAAVTDARSRARTERTSLLGVLIREHAADEAELLQVAAEQQGLRFVDLAGEEIDPAAVRLVPAKLAAHYRVMPVRRGDGRLLLAVSDPFDVRAVEDIESNLRCRVDLVLATRGAIRDALRRHYGVGAETVERILAETPARDVIDIQEESHDLEQSAEDASVVRLVNQLLQDAIADRATDVHFEAYRDGIAVRRRIDGLLQDTSIPRNMGNLYPAIVSRVKLMSRLDIVERRLPQDGRARVRIGGAEYDLRVSVVPSVHGEDVVIRILPATMLFDLADLGFSEAHSVQLKTLIADPHGLVFVTGPTGSGKSTTLYACLSRLNVRSRKIITLEDPVEYELRGITQTQINPRIGLTFAKALPAMLRHDPDVMMVGEVRDRETAEIAIQTAMTGHLVLSTLHTNDAASGAVRLLDMEVEPYLIASTVRAFIAQRLVRVICPACKQAEERDGVTTYQGAGCAACGKSGYRGRVAIAEFLTLVPAIQDLILKRASAAAVRAEADRLGMATLADDGRAKVAEGITTLEEVLRVTAM